MVDRSAPRAVLGQVLAVARAEDVGFLAAALAYYAFVSLVPLALLAFTLASLLGGEALGTALQATLAGVLTPEAAAVLDQAVGSSAGRGSATVVGLLVLAWSGLRFFRGLTVAFSRLYGQAAPPSFVGQVRNAVATLATIAGSVALLALGFWLAARVGGSLGAIAAPVLAILLLPVGFFPLYYLLPTAAVTPHEALPGTLFAAVGWTVLGWAFALYATYAGTASVYGAVGTVLLALTWFYAGSVVVLLGAVLNAVLAGRVADRQLQQVPGRDHP